MARTKLDHPTIGKRVDGFTRAPITIGTGSKSKGTYQVVATSDVVQINRDAEGVAALAKVYAKVHGTDNGMPFVADALNDWLSTKAGNLLRAAASEEVGPARDAALAAIPNTIPLTPRVKTEAELLTSAIADKLAEIQSDPAKLAAILAQISK